MSSECIEFCKSLFDEGDIGESLSGGATHTEIVQHGGKVKQGDSTNKTLQRFDEARSGQ
jgi:hypothetical protein